ncbi:uncharacterized protein LOC123212876 [Mangifera indica]|uniref:uncharacterized protein LOC123212876 n=1 Tax=Mangifera indica TaxID=29780 RepID=UPI001CFC2E9E|nr:uncharacterized protein LOC123212876 [Mangifera indica]
MGQIVKRKKKGRPSKADLARRPLSQSQEPESEVRRSIRRRNVRYDIDYYEDYFDEEDEEEEEERRREKKLKLVVKLNQKSESAEPALNRSRGGHTSEEEEDEEEEEDNKPLKKRKINGGDFSGSEEEDDDNNNYDEEARGRKARAKGQDSASGTPVNQPAEIPLTDKKSLELILDKLQKKDTYGVYAEPVDPEELPDYHDVIEHPMDFATVRKKLGNGSYSTLDQFESDVFLICSNAMQYNAPDSIYYRQARTIQELARKKFHRLRLGIERSEKELKPEKEIQIEKELKLEKDVRSEQRPKLNILAKKQTKKPPFSRTLPEPVGSDFSSGATLATTGDIQNGTIAFQAGGCERPSTTDGLVEGNSSHVDNNLERAEELSSGKGLLSKMGRKPSVVDENRRATYNLSTQPLVRSDSVFTTFDGEIKQLVAVGLHAEYSYARSLARFAAVLGPVAWKVASQRIEQALPPGYKFGRGWVGEYEPLPTPVLMLETCSQKESSLFTKYQSIADVRKDESAFKTPVPTKVHHVSQPVSEGSSSLFHPPNGSSSEGKPPFFASPKAKPSTPASVLQQQNPFSRTYTEPENKVSKQVELNLPPSGSQNNGDLVAAKQFTKKIEMVASRPNEMVARNMNLMQPLPPKHITSNGVGSGGLPNGKVTSNSGNARVLSPASDNVQTARAASYLPYGQEQSVNDPVQLMKILNEKAQKQQNSSNQAPSNTPPIMPSVPFVRRDDSNNAAAAAARAWMSIGAGGFRPPTENSSSPRNQILAESLYNPTREFHTQISRVRGEFPHSIGMQFQSEKNSFPPQAFVPQPVRVVNEAQFQSRPMVFPQVVTHDLSRFQVQTPWQGLSPHSQPRQKQEALPPDLNIGFHSPGSPAKQSSGVLVDPQQPDLALQL